jgi:hypothetical protein
MRYPLPCYWAFPDTLMAGAYPGSWVEAEARSKIRWLLRQGVRLFIDLTEEGEITWRQEPLLPYAHLLREEATSLGITVEHRRHPIPDMGVPTQEGMRHILDRLDRAVASRKLSYVHCLGGKGRTGTVVGCYLIRHAAEQLGTSDTTEASARALPRVTELRVHGEVPDARDSPQTPEQFAFVRDWRIGT